MQDLARIHNLLTLTSAPKRSLCIPQARLLQSRRLMYIYNIELPLLTCQIVGNVGKAFPTFIFEASRLQITMRNRAVISFSHLDSFRINTGIVKCGHYSDMRKS